MWIVTDCGCESPDWTKL